MFTKLDRHIKFTVIASLILFLALSLAWGTTYYSKSKVIGDEGGLIKINQDAEIYIHPGALNDYLFKQNLDRVKITAEMIDLEGDFTTGQFFTASINAVSERLFRSGGFILDCYHDFEAGHPLS